MRCSVSTEIAIPVGVRRHLNDQRIHDSARRFCFKGKGPKKISLLRRDLLRKPVAPIVRIAAVMLESQDAKVIRPDAVIGNAASDIVALQPR